jgi:hypothetical protein
MYPSNLEIQQYLEVMGDHGSKLLSTLGKKQPFIEAFNSKLGSELLHDLITMHSLTLGKLARFEATEEDKADFRASGRLLGMWAQKVSDYEKSMTEIKTTVRKKKVK